MVPFPMFGTLLPLAKLTIKGVLKEVKVENKSGLLVMWSVAPEVTDYECVEEVPLPDMLCTCNWCKW